MEAGATERRARSLAPERRIVVAVAVIALGALLLVACASGSDERATRSDATSDDAELTVTPGGRLVYGVGFDANVWSPFVERWLSSGQLVAQAFYDPLATFDTDGEVVPYLAQAIEPNEDYTTFTIRLRPGVVFHDGTPLDAAAVKLNLDTQGAGTGSNLSPIDGIESVEVIDDLTVAVHLLRSWASFPVQLTGQLGNQAGYMAAPSFIEAADPDALPVGTGPFVATEWRRGSSISGIRNEDYWQPGRPYLDEIEFQFLPDEATRLELLADGKLDAVQVLDLATLELDADLDIELGDQEGAGPDAGAAGDGDTPQPGRRGLQVIYGTDDPFQRFVILNAMVAPTDDPALRKALAQALDREELARSLGPQARPSGGILASTSPWYVDTGIPVHDPEAARTAIAGIEAERGPIAIELVGTSGIESTRMLQQIADAWTDVGVDVSIRTTEERRLPIEVASGRTQAALFDKYSGADPDSYSAFVLSRNINPIGMPSLNLAHVDQPAIDAAIDSGRAVTDPAGRRAAVREIQELINAELGFLWLVEAPSAIVTSPRVHGIGRGAVDGTDLLPIISGRHLFTEVWVSR